MRKPYISGILLAGLILTTALCPRASLQAADQPPNIVFILADDLGYRELGCYGQEKIRTPNIDRLASQGMRFTQHYSGNAVCAPSRCVLLTGKHPGHAHVRNNRSTPPEGQWPIPASEVTFAELLQQAGYVTGAFGKWGLGGPNSEGEPLKQGIDRFFGYNCQAHAHSYYPSYLWDNSSHLQLTNQPAIPGHGSLAADADPKDPLSYEAFKGQDYAPDRINAQALEFIRTHRDAPFLLYYPSVLPHVALHVPDAELEQYTSLGWTDPPFSRAKGFGYTPHFTPRAAYAAMISRLDSYVGRLLDLLDELELSENTIVVFTSDNGTTHLGDEVDYTFFKSVGELRGLKGSLYEGGVRVPAIVRWPHHVAAGSESSRVSGFEDWLPTLLEAAGADSSVPQDCDGISLLPTLQGKSQKPRPYLYREFGGYGGQQSLRVGDWKAIRQDMGKGNLDVELYNLADDIGESQNLAAERPELVQQLTQQMSEVRTPSAEFPLIPLDAPMKERK
ncbi:arylsulfatase [Aureliella helgolandensis]|uniref:Arylsulfatase n=1 Tax=Aureliella helgolandensis TaxID=2527968 RepID=A0A518GCH9_9BACT|nr:arylsulfatase [Aureliella helgolandensis]QDV26306.1 Arylsulfatase [Aureliella helgolandensis]